MNKEKAVTNTVPTVFADNGQGSTITRSKSNHRELSGNGAWFVSLRSVYPEWQWWHSQRIYSEAEAGAIQDFLKGLSNETLQAIMNDKLAKG